MGTKMSKNNHSRESTSNSNNNSNSNSTNSQSNSSSNNSNSNNSHLNDSNNSNNSNTPLVPDLSSYESALRRDPSLQSFDTILRDRTLKSITSLPTVGPLSISSLHHVTGSLVDINEQVVNLILQSKEDIWKNPELLDLVKDYFDNSAATLRFYAALDKALRGVRNSYVFVQLAIARFEEEREGGEGFGFPKTLRELEGFGSIGDPFSEEFFEVFRSVYASQVSMLTKLQAKKKKLDKKLKGLKSYRKVSTALFAAGVAALVICSVVAAAIAAPPLVAALVAASSAPVGAVGKWINSLWKGYENGVRDELDLVFEMEIESFTAIKELETIRVLVENLKVEIEGMVFKAGFAVRENDDVAVSLAIEEIKKNLGAFMNAMDVLGDHSDRFSRDVCRARAVILQRIIKFPSSG